MNERLELLKSRMRAGEHKELRQAQSIELLPECEAEGLSWPRRVARLVRRQCEAEQVVIAPEEKIVFTRTLPGVPPVYTPEEWAQPDRRADSARAWAGQQYLRGLGSAALAGAARPPGSGAEPHACAWRMTTKRRSSSTVPSKPSMRRWNWPRVMPGRPASLAGRTWQNCSEAGPGPPCPHFPGSLAIAAPVPGSGLAGR